MNLKLTVKPPKHSLLPPILMWSIILSVMGIMSLLVLIGHVFHINQMIQSSFLGQAKEDEEIESVNERFGDYREVEIKYKKP